MLSSPISRAELCPTAPLPGLLPASGIFRILVCRPTHSLGNTLLLTPLLRDLQTIYPGAEIDIVTRTPIGRDVYAGYPNVRHVHCLPAHAFAHPLAFNKVISRVRSAHYDLVIDPHPHSRTGRTLLSLSQATYKLGFAGYRDSVLTHAVPIPESVRHTAHRAVSLLRSARGLQSIAVPTLDIGLTQFERMDGHETLQRLVDPPAFARSKGVIGVFANATGPKLIAQEWWQSLLSALAARHPEHIIVEIVPAFGRSMLGSRHPTFYTSDIRRLAGVLSQLSLFISADCGIMHLACASGVPVAGIFSATDAGEWGPYGPHDCTIDARGLTAEQVAEQLLVSGC
jgi:ADP-heptose:LPS heptosyltransferase